MYYIVHSSLRLASFGLHTLDQPVLGYITVDIFVESTITTCSAFGCKSGCKSDAGVQSGPTVYLHAQAVHGQDLCAKFTLLCTLSSVWLHVASRTPLSLLYLCLLFRAHVRAVSLPLSPASTHSL